MLSPVLQKSVCGNFRESAAKSVELEDVELASFQHVLDLWCGRESVEFGSVQQLMRAAALTDRLQVIGVTEALEDALIKQLRVDNCVEVLIGSGELMLGQVEAAAERLALSQFEEVALTEGFTGIGEEALGRLLDADALLVEREELVLEGLVQWMAARGEGGGLVGRGLLGTVRFALMDAGYLAREVEGRVPAVHREWARGAVEEALRAKLAPAERRGRLQWNQLGPKAATLRTGVRPERAVI